MVSALLATAVIGLVNAERVEHHVAPLRPQVKPALTLCVAHELLTCLQRRGYPTRTAAVNTAWGFASPRAAVRAWMLSPPHRAILLSAAYTSTSVRVRAGHYEQAFAGPRVSTSAARRRRASRPAAGARPRAHAAGRGSR